MNAVSSITARESGRLPFYGQGLVTELNRVKY